LATGNVAATASLGVEKRHCESGWYRAGGERKALGNKAVPHPSLADKNLRAFYRYRVVVRREAVADDVV
jgi:hypothetical protein